MKLQDQVCSLELAKQLKELGFKQESLFWWNYNPAVPEQGWYLDDENLAYKKEHTISAYTVAELGEMLPKIIKIGEKEEGILHISIQNKTGWIIIYDWNAGSLNEFADTESDARAKMLIYLKTNNLI